MFFRMFKKDLTEKKGLNVILLLFMITAAILVTASSIQLYTYIYGRERSYERCRSADITMITIQDLDKHEEYLDQMIQWLSRNDNLTDYSVTECLRFPTDAIRFDSVPEDSGIYIPKATVVKLPDKMNLAYDIYSKPFYVENGCIAVSQNTQNRTGIQTGQKIRLTTQMGYTYEFTVSHIFKDPALSYLPRYIVSDADYDVLKNECPVAYDVFELQFRSKRYTDPQILFNDMEMDEIPCIPSMTVGKEEFDNDYIIAMVVAIFMSGISVFIILMIFTTIRFTMLSAIKREMKEIGMMKAIGVDSFSFRWLFAAKYIIFSIIGGIIGIAVGIPVANMSASEFCVNILEPTSFEKFAIAAGASLSVTAIIMIFTMLTMRHMKKITVMNAIRSTNKGEEAKLLSGFSLSKRKKMSIPGFLAVTDIFGRFRRYIFLVAAYSLGIAIIMLTVNVKHSIINETYIKHCFPMIDIDFDIRFTDDMYSTYIQKYGGYKGMINQINAELEENGIPAEIRYTNYTDGKMKIDESTCIDFNGYFGCIGTEEYYYSKGTAPTKPDEIAVTYYTAKKYGFSIGDKIYLDYYLLDDNKVFYEERSGEFTITGFMPIVAENYVLFGNGFTGCGYDINEISYRINAPRSEFDTVRRQIQELYEDCTVKSTEDAIKSRMSNYNTMFTLMRNVMSAVVLGVFILLTMLYEEIFIEDELSDIALLKSLGISKGSIKLWHIIRMVILAAASYILALVIISLFGGPIVSFAVEKLAKLSGFIFMTDKLAAILFIPFVSAAAIILPLLIKAKMIDKIEIQNIRED